MAKLDAIAMLAETDGVVLVDKPENLSAHDVVKAVKAHFNLVKVGHGGTLEPNGTGLMALLVGDGTHLSQDVMGADRVYTATIRLGRVTNTQDRDGATLSEHPFDGVTREKLDAALPEFRGDIFQTPPPFSVFKRPDRPACDVGTTDPADLQTRLSHVYRLTVTDFAPPLVSFELFCTKGFIARAFAHDLGQFLGCGACLESLRRTKQGRFDIADAIGFMDLLKLDAAGFLGRVIPLNEARAR